MSPVILITGATGLLGPYLTDAAAKHGKAITLARRNADIECDLTDADATRRAIGEAKPDIVLHAAAMTDVDVCERDPEAAEKINAGAAKHVTDALDGRGFLVAFSTIAVYPDAEGPHKEGTEKPVNVYGRTKLAGEQEARRHPRSLVIRAAMFGASRNPARKSLSDFIVEKLSNKSELTLFKDELFSPLHVATLAGYAVDAAKRGVMGVYNAATSDGMSKAAFGLAIAARLKLATDNVVVCDSRTMPGRSRRALDMRLDPALLERALGVTMPRMQEEIARL